MIGTEAPKSLHALVAELGALGAEERAMAQATVMHHQRGLQETRAKDRLRDARQRAAEERLDQMRAAADHRFKERLVGALSEGVQGIASGVGSSDASGLDAVGEGFGVAGSAAAATLGRATSNAEVAAEAARQRAERLGEMAQERATGADRARDALDRVLSRLDGFVREKGDALRVALGRS
ncbi:MAG: hypothetical protein KC416_02010 [Myxococcales bacterium]|nr:hypothetical protein [Myxococcales bacterium]